MHKTVRDHLLSALANLGEAQLKNFKSKLNEIQLAEGYDNIPKGVLEKADPIELTDKMIQSYQEIYAVEVAEEVLRAINESQLASRLATNTRIARAGVICEGSMHKTVRDHLLSALANLGEAQLKNFKSKLNEIRLQKGYDNIPKGVLEKADPIELTDKMIQSYQETYAVMVAEEVLRAINEIQLASRLATNTRIGSESSSSDGDLR
ncbi:caspase a-like [Mauremys reevesii]|uniref:caspase a-like n=1 Tax=Mauremys reevesii TaxID=260615 RepID=UPI00193F2037|nr:caspase a-like [Mauremys reevesii]